MGSVVVSVASAVHTMISLTSNKRHIGDLLNILNILQILLFISVIVAHARGFGVQFSPAFAEDGFCIANKDQHVLLQSHALCFYEDTVLAILIWFLASHVGKGIISDNDVSMLNKNALGCFFHGAAHMSLAYRDYISDGESSADLPFPLRITMLSIFWLSMMNLIHKDDPFSRKAAHAFTWTLTHLFVPKLYAFAFVHSILVLEMGIKELLEQKKDEFYNLKTVLLLTPNCVIAWVEAFACENYLRPIGGHAIYDVAIPLTNIAYFCIIFGHQQMSKKID